jgi:HlyD family secretion protein
MDVPRGKEVARRRLIRRIVYIVLILIAIPLITWGLSRLRPAAPEVELATVWPDTVKRGPMVRDVRGLGTLVVTQFKWLSAQFDGRVEKMNVDNGSVVHKGDVLMVIKNDQMEQDIRGLETNIQGALATKQAAEATKTDIAVKLKTQQLQQQSVTAQVETDYKQAQLTADKDQQLFDKGLEPDLTLQLSKSKAAQLKKSWEISKQQLDIFGQSMQAQLDAQQSIINTLDQNIKKLESDLQQKKKDLASLTITTDVDGQRRRDRTAGVHRYAQWHYSRTCYARRAGRGKRNGGRGRFLRRSASRWGAPGPECGWHHYDREIGGCGLCWPAGDRPGW